MTDLTDTNSEFSVHINHADRVLTIQGVRYSFDLFDQLGLGPIGRKLRIVGRSDGVVTLQEINSVAWRIEGGQGGCQNSEPIGRGPAD